MSKSVLTTALTILWISLLSAQQKELTYANERFDASAIKQVEASSPGGAILIEGNAASTATVEVILRRNGRTGSSENDLKSIFEKEYDLELTSKNGILVAKAQRKSTKSSGNNPLSVSFRISVPRHTASDIKTAGGSITLNNLEGTQNFRTSGGSLQLANLSGALTGHTSGGSIKLTDCQGNIDMSTSGGSIRAENVQGQIQIKTSGGSIKGSSVSGTLSAQTSGGSIALTQSEGSIDARTSGGSINVSLTKVTGPVQLRTSAGSVRIAVPKGGYDVDIQGSRVELPSAEFQGTTNRKAASGKLNGGGEVIEARTSGGTAQLSWL